jgi:NADPH-dependent 7-cyano-7-deazaguanine reductase QueF
MDARVTMAMMEQRMNDKSFTEKPSGLERLFSFRDHYSYTQHEVREIWFQGIQHGMEQGIVMASLEGQIVDLKNSCNNERHKEFFKKFCELAVEYKCQIQYHPNYGVVVIDRNYELPEPPKS